MKKEWFSGICRGGCASSCTAGGRQFNCRQNWRAITANPNEPKEYDIVDCRKVVEIAEALSLLVGG